MPYRFRGALVACSLAGALIGLPATAAPLRFHCAALDATPEAELTFEDETLTVVEDGHTATLEGSVEGQPPENYTINATGQGEASLPEAAAMDGCLAAALKAQGAAATDGDTVAYLVNSCRLELAPKAVAQTADLSYQLIVMAPEPAQLFVTRTYTMPSSVTGAPIAIPEWPMRNCNLVP